MRDNQQALLDRLDPDRRARVADPDDFSVAESEVEEELVDNRRVARGEVVKEALNEQAAQVERLAEYEVGPQLEEVAGRIRADSQALKDAQGPALDEALDAASKNVQANVGDLNQMIDNIRGQLNREASAELEASQENVSELQENEQAVDDQQGDAESSDGGDDDLPIGDDV